MQNIFTKKETTYDLRKKILLTIPPMKNTVTYGTNSFSFRASLIWNSLPDEIKNSNNLQTFKEKLKIAKEDVKCSC